MSNPNQGAATRARNEEIERRVTAGESGPALAQEYGVTQPRIFQIARAVREARGQATPPRPYTRKQGAIRPRLRKVELGLWECTDGTIARRGETQREAYDRWMTAAIADAQPAKRAQLMALTEPPAPYTGPVTVVPGTTAAPRPLVMPPSMRFALDRAGQAQKPIRSIAGA